MHPQECGLVANTEGAANHIGKVGFMSVSHDSRNSVERLAYVGLNKATSGRLATLELAEGLAVEA